MSTAEPGLEYAAEVLGELFPKGAVATARDRTSVGAKRTFAISPSAGRPRLLVPTYPRDAAAAALRGYGGRLTRQARWSYGAAARSLAVTGPAPLRTRLTVSSNGEQRVAGIDDHLTGILGREVSVAVHLTPSRANRKPIVQALAAGERHPLAFAKVAIDPLTSRLVEQEARVLATLAERSAAEIVVPTVAHHGDFSGHSVLTLHPLPTWLPGRAPTLTEVAPAMREVAALAPATRLPLAHSAYWGTVQRQAADLPQSPRATRLVHCVERMTNELGPVAIRFTASHGDWSPWNMRLTKRGLLVWDWERFESETPEGFDLLHFRLNDQLIRRGWSGAEAAHRLIDEAPDLLAQGGTSDPPLQTVLLYLLYLGLRYETDGQAAAGAAIGYLETWLLPALESGLADLS